MDRVAILHFPTAFWFRRDMDRVSLEWQLCSRAEVGCLKVRLSMRGVTEIKQISVKIGAS